MAVEDFQTKTKTFVSWLSSMGVIMSPKMALVDLRPSRGRGVVATADFEEDEMIFSIPRSAVLNIKALTPIAKCSEQALASMPGWLALTAVMLSEGLKKNSKWAPYLAVLPQQLDSLIFWSESELLQLQASAVVQKIGKASAEEMFSRHITPLGLDNSSTETCHRVASIIMAYAFDIPEKLSKDEIEDAEDGDDLVSDNGEEELTILSMIPLADMLNADADRNNARLVCDNGDLEMKAIKPIARGDEIFNDYGQLPRSDLLRRYGYVTKNYSSFDIAEISTQVLLSNFRNGETLNIEPLSRADLEKRVELAERENVYEESYDISHSGPDEPSTPDELLALLYLLLLDAESLAAIQSSQTYLPSRSKLATELVGQVLVRILKSREKEYATTLEEDERLLQDKSLSSRTVMAVQVRLGEKKVLRGAIHEAAMFAGSNKRMRNGKPGSEWKRKAEDSSNPKKKGRFI